ncbi:MAG: RnfABCDGE type electron transport complex subunit D [Phycisphaerae bacterium]|nr:RnfABCDGE type electron transport complex subunit D [Phycisphaerae bacterium]
MPESNAQPEPRLHVAPAPHVGDTTQSTRRMMLDVLIALAPVAAMGVYVFGWYAVKQIGVCVLSCLAAEAIFTAMRRRRATLGDLSAVVTGAILAFSLPATCPIYVAVIASFAAIGLGKVVFGGLGGNVFNPAMVGRAFAMLAFTKQLAAQAYVDAGAGVHALTQATPLTAHEAGGPVASLADLFWGTTNGCVGETSAIACLVGGLYLCLRRTASWELPAAAIATVAVIAGGINLANPAAEWTVLHHLLGGALLLGAFFIITDPVSTPLTRKGKLLYGVGFGALVMLIRTLSNYPEGVMFSVLLMNAVTPLINRWTIPAPLGGRQASG